jgi:threonine/homoserine/homoserine lactone efflux protein
MELTLLLKGLIAGLVTAVPVGPVGILCARRTMTHGRQAGFVSGMGAATADAFFGFVAAFGMTFMSEMLSGKQFWLRLVGGAFLLLIGIKTFFEKPERRGLFSFLRKKQRHAGFYASTLFLTLTNPMTILSLAALFAALGLAGATSGVFSALTLVLGVFLGAVLWWLSFIGVFTLFNRRFSHHEILLINRIAGLIMASCGVFALASLLWQVVAA